MLLREVQAGGDCVETCERLVTDCHRSSEPLKSTCSASSFVRVSRQLADLDLALDDLRLRAQDCTTQHELETYHRDNYDNMLQAGPHAAAAAAAYTVAMAYLRCFGNLRYDTIRYEMQF